jgi:acetyl esterase/lipase
MDVVYAVVSGHELKLDIAVPRNLAAPAPAIVDIQGGAWRRIQNSAEDAKFWARYGFVGVSITHRTSDIAIFPAAVHDCKAVIRWLRANAKKYNIDPDRIGVTGFSSGGNLAALLGTSGGDGFLEGTEGNLGYSSRVQAVVDHFGPTDFMKMNDGKEVAGVIDHFAPDSPESLLLGGPLKERADLARLANPLTYIDAGDPPTLIAHGEKDRLVPFEQSEILYEAMKKAGVPVEFIRVKNADHMYRPYPEGAAVSPDVNELNRRSAAWFFHWLGAPKLKSLAESPPPPAVDPALKTSLYYLLTIDLPGRTSKSYVKGTFWVRCGDRELASGEIDLRDLSSDAGRTFKHEFVAVGVDFKSCELTWNFSGEIYDSVLNEKLPLMMRQIAKYNDQVEGIGFHFQIGADGTPGIQKKVYMKSGGSGRLCSLSEL